MLELQLQALTLGLLHFLAILDQAVLNALGIGFQTLQAIELRTEFLLRIDGILLRGIGLQEGHLVVQHRHLHFCEGRSSGQQSSRNQNPLSQLTHDALLQQLLLSVQVV